MYNKIIRVLIIDAVVKIHVQESPEIARLLSSLRVQRVKIYPCIRHTHALYHSAFVRGSHAF